jgi:outer membrane protein assembly factor BamA
MVSRISRSTLAPAVMVISLGLTPSSGESLQALYLKLGGITSGSGLSGGLEYRRDSQSRGVVSLRGQALVSQKLFQEYELQIMRPRLWDNRWFGELLLQYRNFRRVDFYGIGPKTERDEKTNFRYTGLTALATVGFNQRTAKLHWGGRFGAMRASAGPGGGGSRPSIEERFSPERVPGLGEAPGYLVFGAFLHRDGRDDPEDPRRGSLYEVDWALYHDQKLSRFGFQELDLTASFYLPTSRRSVLALRGKGIFTAPRQGQEVPFFFLPTLGGYQSLHGFDHFRFRDRHLVVVNAEYRWELTPSLRAELLVDGGQVFSSVEELDFGKLEFSAGTGLRLKLGTSVVIGAAIGAGREGAELAVRGDFRF